MSYVEVAFWIAAGFVFYIYFGYPLLVFLGATLRPRPVIKRNDEPRISVVIAAYNEARHIGRTLDLMLQSDYPSERLRVIVISDGSTDGTDDVVRTYAQRGVTLLRQEPRNGKTAALNAAMPHATGEIVVFADANSMYEPQTIRHLVKSFADPTVGYVTGKLGYRNPDGSLTGDGCSLYMKYENFIRTCESSIGSLVGVNGGIDAIRRDLYVQMQPDDLPDLVLPLLVVGRGFRVVYEPAALLTEYANDNASDEYRMRVRVSLRAFWTLSDMGQMMSPFQHGFYALQLFSHKALRYMAFAFMFATFASAAWLSTSAPFYLLIFVAQLVFALLAWLGFVAERRGWESRGLSALYYFALVNAAAMQAFMKFVRRKRHRMWKPRLG